MNQAMTPSTNETPEQVTTRRQLVIDNNREMTNFIEQLSAVWSSLTTEEERINKVLEIYQKNGVIIDSAAAKANIFIFEKYLEFSKNDVSEQNTLMNKEINNGRDISFRESIQEPVTYAFSTPAIAIILNGLEVPEIDPSMTYNTNPTTFWGKLKDMFIKILNSIFQLQYNNRSFLAKLSNTVEVIYDNTVKEMIVEAKTKQESKLEDVPFKESIIEVEESMEDILKKFMEDQGLTNEDIKDEDPNINPSKMIYVSEYIVDNVYLDTTSNESNKNISRHFISPNEQILDSNKEPIC